MLEGGETVPINSMPHLVKGTWISIGLRGKAANFCFLVKCWQDSHFRASKWASWWSEKKILQWFWLKSDLHKPRNGNFQVPFGLGQESRIVTKPHQGFFGKGFGLVKPTEKLVNEVFVWI
jgi:hypothetical protein